MNRLRMVFAVILSVLTGLVFLYSAYSKLLPIIETFEFTFVDLGVANWYSAPVFARLLIGLELFTGTLLIICYRLRTFTLPLTIGILVFFTIYLCVLMAVSGNSGNCGCFGEHLRMTPLQGILKNILMIGAAVVIYLLQPGWTTRRHFLFIFLLAIPCAGLPFILNPVDYSYTSNNLDEKVNYPIGIDLLYQHHDSVKVEKPKVELRQGKHVVAFLSLSCGHCRVAAKKFRLIKKENPSLPIYFVLNGDSLKYKEFIADTKATNIPSSFCGAKVFVQLAGSHLPRIYYLDNGIVVKKVDYFELNQYDIEHWLGKD
jgi:hypothetical protein